MYGKRSYVFKVKISFSNLSGIAWKGPKLDDLIKEASSLAKKTGSRKTRFIFIAHLFCISRLFLPFSVHASIMASGEVQFSLHVQRIPFVFSGNQIVRLDYEHRIVTGSPLIADFDC